MASHQKLSSQAEEERASKPGGGDPRHAIHPSERALFPFVDLKAQFAPIREEVMAAIARVMESQQFILGNEVDAFEKEMARQLEVKEVVSCASGTAALEIALQSLRIGPGDEVITTPYTFVATAGAVAAVSARPVFVDIDPVTFNLDASGIEAAITGKTRAIIPVHLFGLPADMGAIMNVAAMHNLAVIEDAAQAIGASYRGARVGSIGTLGCFSFFPSKNLGGAGDGGMVTTNDAALANRLRLIRVHGSREKYHYETLGVNSRLDALQAAILRVKLPHLPEWTLRRQEIAARYQEMFARQNLEKILTPPAGAKDLDHVFNQYVIRCPKRDSLREHLRERGIPAEVYYPAPLHCQAAFAYLDYRDGAFPQAEAASRETLALPIYPELSAQNQAIVVREIKNFFESHE